MCSIATGSNKNMDANTAVAMIIWANNSTEKKNRDEIKYASMQWENN